MHLQYDWQSAQNCFKQAISSDGFGCMVALDAK
jgi:hypothetical protein